MRKKVKFSPEIEAIINEEAEKWANSILEMIDSETELEEETETGKDTEED